MATGAIYALVAAGFVIVYRAVGIFNFAQTEFYTVGGMVMATLVLSGLPIAISAIVTVAVVILLGLVCERLVFRGPVLAGVAALNLDVASIALALIIRSFVLLIWGPEARSVPGLGGVSLSVGGISVSWQHVLVVAVSGLALLAIYGLLYRTKLGLALRATASDRQVAAMVGIPTTTVLAVGFGTAAGLGAIGGVLVAPLFLAQFTMGVSILIKAFAAWILGGLTSIPGVIAGAVVLGLAESVTSFYGSAAYGDAVAFLVLLLALAVRPQGLLSRSAEANV